MKTLEDQIEWAKRKLKKAAPNSEVKVKYTPTDNGLNITISWEYDIKPPLSKAELKQRFKRNIL